MTYNKNVVAIKHGVDRLLSIGQEAARLYPDVSFALGHCFAEDSRNIVDVLKTADIRVYEQSGRNM